MKQPWWKIAWSYLFAQHIESTSSDFNPELHVYLVNGRYQLTTANAVYSFADLYTNFRRAFERIGVQGRDIREVLILGFGLGSIPYMLEQVFGCHFNYTAVEVDEEVLYLANKYTLPGIASPIEMVVADAEGFVAQCETRYDLICMDVFQDDDVPEDFETMDFLQNLKDLLQPQGILLYNRLAYSPADRERSKRFFDEAFQRVFPEAMYIDTGSNWIMVNREVS